MGSFEMGGWELPPAAVLAPMAGVTDSPYRRIARRFGAGLLYTECISAEGVRRLGERSLELAQFHPEERPLAVQLFGSEPQQFADAAALIKERVRPDMIDVNCGCPVRKFVTRGCGGWLMQEPERVGRIVEAVVRAGGLPVSVKLRRGYRAPDETAPEAARAAVEAGAALVTVHGRWVRKASGTRSDRGVVARVKEALPDTPVVGNGDVFSRDDAAAMLRETNCDRVMVGRGAQGRPWVFAQLLDGGSGDDAGDEPDAAGKIEVLLEHYQLALEHYPERRAVRLMRKHIGWYIHGMPGAAKLRREVMTLNDAGAVQARLMEYREGMISISRGMA